MSRALISRTLVVVALAAVFVLRSDSRGDAPSNPPAKPQGATAVKPVVQLAPRPANQPTVQQALAEATEFDFVDTPLKDVVETIASRHKINVLLDTTVLAAVGITPDTPVTATLKGIPLGSALHGLLAQKDLDYFGAGDNVLMITTADDAKRHLVLRVYDVRHFAEPVGELSARLLPAADASGALSAFRFGMFPITTPAFGHDVLLEDRSPWDGIRELVTSTVSPASWQCFGGEASIGFANGNMIVAQTEEAQSEVAELLSELEAAQAVNPAGLKSDDATMIRNSSAVEKRIGRSLDAPVTMDFTDTPLKDIVDSLQSQLGIPAELDTRSLTDAGVTGDATFTFAVKAVPAHEALRLFLAQKGLDYVVEQDVLLITTDDLAKTKTVTAVFPVGDLVDGSSSVTDKDRYAPLLDAIRNTVQPASWNTNGGPGSIVPFPVCHALVANQTEPILREIQRLMPTLHAAAKNSVESVVSDSGPVVRIYSLPGAIAPTATAGDNEKVGKQVIDTIQKLVAPKHWGDSGTFINVVDRALVVRQTPEVQRQIQNLLDAVRAVSEPELRPAGNAGPAPQAPAAASPANPVSERRGPAMRTTKPGD